MRQVAAALAASRVVAPYETMSRESGDVAEKAQAVQVAKRRRFWRRVRASDAWKPTHARP